MQYAQQADIISQYGQAQLLLVSDRDQDGVSDAGVADTALTNASAEIDTYLSNRYTLPLTTVDPVLVLKCVDIAIYLMAVPRPEVLTDAIERRYTDAVSWLKSVRDGTIDLGQPQDQVSKGGGPEIVSQPRNFGRDNLLG